MPGHSDAVDGSAIKAGSHLTDALDAAILTRDGARLVSSYLREHVGEFPVASRSCLISPSERYERIADLLKPAITGNGGPSYEEFVGDLAEQRKHAKAVLRPIAQELAKVADDIGGALADAMLLLHRSEMN